MQLFCDWFSHGWPMWAGSDLSVGEPALGHHSRWSIHRSL